jgi:phosphohistidine phosphatase
MLSMAPTEQFAAGIHAAQRRLVLLRHAKSAYPHGVPDRERPLAGKGRRNAQATGEWLRDEGPRADLVLCSDAQRARHTWEIVAACLPSPPIVKPEPRLYLADPETLLTIVRGTDDSVHTLVVVGHEPTMSAVILLLAGEGSDDAALAQVTRKFPTNGVAVLHYVGPWSGLAVGRAVLETFTVPRA